MKLTNIIHQANAEKKAPNGELNGHAVPAPDKTEPGMYLKCSTFLFM